MTLIDFPLGLAIFLYGMHELERGIRKLSDARLRYWLRNSTGTSFGSVLTGIFTTAILQSSSMVSLMVLAFAAAGILPLVNSVGIILGANLGTTLTGWIVATLGFKLNLEAVSLEVFASGAAVIVLLGRYRRLRYLAIAVVGLGLLLFGLGLMKSSMEALPEVWNVERLQNQPAIVYLLLGLALAALIQSSSAVMMMALGALNAGILSLPEAAALIIGADLGTTSTTALGSLVGGAIKKQLAMAHFLFNLIVDSIAFLVLLPLLPVLIATLGIEDPLYSLVAFHTVMNLLGLCAFIPFINPFTAFLVKHIGQQSDDSSILQKVPTEITDAALAALSQAVRELVTRACYASTQLIHSPFIENELPRDSDWARRLQEKGFDENYESLKQSEGEILKFSIRTQAQPLSVAQTLTIDRLVRATRSIVYAVKTLKDIEHDLSSLRFGDHRAMKELYARQQTYIETTSRELIRLLEDGHAILYAQEKLEELKSRNDAHQNDMNRFVHTHAQSLFADKQTLSIELNVNWEVHHSYKALIGAIQDLLSSTQPGEEKDTTVEVID